MSWLTADGLAAALVVGGTITVGLGWRGAVLLVAFFVSGSVLTQLAGDPPEGSAARNARQVAANGGAAAAAALLGSWPVAAGALAAATADTWATEIGAFSKSPPRLITTGALVPRGASGGITVLGTVGGITGAAAMAAVASLLWPRGLAPGLAVAAAGVVGMLADSVLGATVQGLFECGRCGARFERSRTVCHEPVRLVRGWRWLDNDGVNLVATLVGAGTAVLGWRFAS